MRFSIVAIDDEPHNLLLIEAFLAGKEYDVSFFPSGLAALAHLRGGAKVDAILLDRMMPVMDGLGFMRELRMMPEFSRVPVIMQSAASFPEQIAEGIAEGAYYYLTKPFARPVLTAVLARALADHVFDRGVRDNARSLAAALGRLGVASFSFRTLDDVHEVSFFLASLYPDPASAILGIRELMVNAVEHGNLGITYEKKSQLVRDGTWQEELVRRLESDTLGARQAVASIERGRAAIVLTIEDQGEGFAWEGFIEFDRARAGDPNGRGIAMSRMVSFDSVAYVAPGNKVFCTKRL